MSHSDCPADYVEIRRAICPAKRGAAVEYALQPVGCTVPNLWYFRINRPTRRNYEFSLERRPRSRRFVRFSFFLFDSLADSVSMRKRDSCVRTESKIRALVRISSSSQFEIWGTAREYEYFNICSTVQIRARARRVLVFSRLDIFFSFCNTLRKKKICRVEFKTKCLKF